MSELTPGVKALKSKPFNLRKIGSVGISFTLAIILLYLALKGLDWNNFILIIRSAKYQIFLISVPIAIISYYFRALRWRVLLNSGEKVDVGTAFWANMVGYLGNAYLPARLGEVMRSYVVGKRNKNIVSFAFATAVTERFIDLIVLVCGVGIALIQLPGIAKEISTALQIMTIIGLIGLAIILFIPKVESPIIHFISLLSLPVKLQEAIKANILNFLSGMRSLHSFRRFGSFMVYTLFIWLLDTTGATILAFGIGHTLFFYQAFILLACLGVSSALPSTPGNLGIYQFVALAILVPFGFLKSEALVYILLLQASSYITVTIFGLIGLWKLR